MREDGGLSVGTYENGVRSLYVFKRRCWPGLSSGLGRHSDGEAGRLMSLSRLLGDPGASY